MKLTQFIKECESFLERYGDGEVYSLNEFGDRLIPVIYQHWKTNGCEWNEEKQDVVWDDYPEFEISKTFHRV